MAAVNGHRPAPPGVDTVIEVPPVDSITFGEAIERVVATHAISAVLPWTDRDALALSGLVGRLHGAVVVCPRRELVELACDKWASAIRLDELGVAVPRSRRVSSGADLRSAADELGYPARSLVLKPRSLSGARGVWSLRADADPFAAGPFPQATVEAMAVAVDGRGGGRSTPLVLQEEVEGDDVSVDVLAVAGSLRMAVARTRTATLGGLCVEGMVRPPSGAERRAIEKIVVGLDWSSLANIQLKAGRSGPVVYEVNARAAGSIGISARAGVDLLAAAIDHAHGVPAGAWADVLPTGFRRHWHEQCWRSSEKAP
jgi:predicted ATP-grasp superfamily ATP-dependent carboligase